MDVCRAGARRVDVDHPLTERELQAALEDVEEVDVVDLAPDAERERVRDRERTVAEVEQLREVDREREVEVGERRVHARGRQLEVAEAGLVEAEIPRENTAVEAEPEPPELLVQLRRDQVDDVLQREVVGDHVEHGGHVVGERLHDADHLVEASLEVGRDDRLELRGDVADLPDQRAQVVDASLQEVADPTVQRHLNVERVPDVVPGER